MENITYGYDTQETGNASTDARGLSSVIVFRFMILFINVYPSKHAIWHIYKQLHKIFDH